MVDIHPLTSWLSLRGPYTSLEQPWEHFVEPDGEQRIGQYTFQFFSIIRKFLVDEPSYFAYVPDTFKSAYLLLAIKCNDGYVVAIYLSALSDNFFYFEKNRSVNEVISELPNRIIGADKHTSLILDDWDGDDPERSLHVTAMWLGSSGGPLRPGGWQFLSVASRTYGWPLSDATKRAQDLVDIFRARAVIYEPSGASFLPSMDKLVIRGQMMSDLHHILGEYRSILSEENHRERIIHRFLNSHPHLIIPNKKRMWYEYDLREDGRLIYKMDIVIELTEQRYLLVELENPNHRLFTKSGDFTRAVNHAEKQISDWMLWIRRNQTEIQLALPGIDAPEGLVIIGRNIDVTKEQRAAIRMRNEKHHIKLMTYDDLAEQADNYIRHLLDI